MRATFTTQHIRQRTCIHPVSPGGPPCGAPCTKDTPNGWLCPNHEGWVNRKFEVPK